MAESNTRSAAQQAPAGGKPPSDSEAGARAVRDAYIAARFAGVARSGEDLAETERVIRAARLYFQESHKVKAAELLDLAIALHPAREEPWLARLELAFLARNSSDFTGLAQAFRHFHPASAAWKEVARLGAALCPGEPLFGPATATEASRYGPWPDTPNWIQASWDLTSEVQGAEFHNAMLRRAHAARPEQAARAA
ncbi:MAG TPA: hypothetical protein VN598_16185 [Usitatibacter sp.]|nr:hypothetical protein [Usitatibacter sp.]